MDTYIFSGARINNYIIYWLICRLICIIWINQLIVYSIKCQSEWKKPSKRSQDPIPLHVIAHFVHPIAQNLNIYYMFMTILTFKKLELRITFLLEKFFSSSSIIKIAADDFSVDRIISYLISQIVQLQCFFTAKFCISANIRDL